jgi:hypothetical protein
MVAGIWGTSATCQVLTPSLPSATGITYDEVLNGLWATVGAEANNLLRIPLGGGLIESFTTRPEYQNAKSCTMAHTRFGYVLTVLLEADPAALVFYDVGYVPTTGLPFVDRELHLELRALPSVLLAGSGQGKFLWDGYDAGGGLQPSGIYQVRAQSGSRTGETRLLILPSRKRRVSQTLSCRGSTPRSSSDRTACP